MACLLLFSGCRYLRSCETSHFIALLGWEDVCDDPERSRDSAQTEDIEACRGELAREQQRRDFFICAALDELNLSASLPGKVALELRQEVDVVIQKDGGQAEFEGPGCFSDSILSHEYGKRRTQQITTPQESRLHWKHWGSDSGILASMLACCPVNPVVILSALPLAAEPNRSH